MAEIGSSPAPSAPAPSAPASRPEPAAPAASPTPSASPASTGPSTRDTATVTPGAEKPDKPPSEGTRSLLSGLESNFGNENTHDIDMVKHTQSRLAHTAAKINDPATSGAERLQLQREQAQLRKDLDKHIQERPLPPADPNAPSAVNQVARAARGATSGTLQAVEDQLGGGRMSTLRDIDEGRTTPDPNSRLGAYDATKGYKEGTVGNSVHNAIGTIYGVFGTAGEEQIGKVFNSPEAKALYDQPVNSPASKKMAEMEHAYWSKVRQENPTSFGGNMGSLFSPDTRDVLQRHIFR